MISTVLHVYDLCLCGFFLLLRNVDLFTGGSGVDRMW